MSRITRGLALVVLGILITCSGALIYNGLTAPALPYFSMLPYTVANITRPADAGALQPQDNIITFNGQPFYTCFYMGSYSPIYEAPRNQEIPVTYWRPDLNHPSGGKLGETTIILRSQNLQSLINLGFSYLVAVVFLGVGAFFLIFRWSEMRWWSLACLFSSLIMLSMPEAAPFRTPFAIAFWGGLPISAVC